MAYPGPPRRPGGLVRNLLLAVIITLIISFLRHQHLQFAPPRPPSTPFLRNESPHAPQRPAALQRPIRPKPKEPAIPEPVTNLHGSFHPIDTLILHAQKTFDGLLQKESRDLKAAAAEYRTRRGRHPPPGFDTWFNFAKDHGAVVVEDFFDQIYHDLAPFWGLPPSTMRAEAADYEMRINIRDRKATTGSTWFWTEIWLDLIQTIQHMLPDMDIALNAMDEPRVVVPWEQINEYMEIERKTRSMPRPREVISEFQSLAPLPTPDAEVNLLPKDWEHDLPYWKLVARGCHPDSLTRKAASMTDFSQTPSISLAHATPHMFEGYVSNFSLAADFCHQPDIQSLHGMMIEPLSVSTTKTFFPMFGGSKLAVNNEILLPAPVYWSNEERFSGGEHHGEAWGTKLDKAVWRGVATGGHNREENWKGFQRHRFAAMTNSTKISQAESWEVLPQNWAMPTSQYDLAARQENRLGEWTGEWADVGLTDLMCDVQQSDLKCNYTDPYFSLTAGMSMREQFNRKYLPDIDGNSFSGRYRGFLMSSSLPIKATIFREWHDSRLVPWVHFVPMDNRFTDLYGIMQYFLGYAGEKVKVAGHDAAAEKIATAGQAWANKVLRREDMQIYTLRLLLEYARLADDRREKLGFVKDLG